MSSVQSSVTPTIGQSFDDVLSKSKYSMFHLLICCNLLSLLNESIKCIWPLYAQSFDTKPDEIGWILFLFYITNALGHILIQFLYAKEYIKLTTFPLFILLISSVLIFFQGTTIRDYRQTSFTQIFILFICYGFISYHSLYNIMIEFSNIIMPLKYSHIFNQNILSLTHLLFSMIGPSLSGLILYLNNNDLFSVFYIVSIMTLAFTIYSFILCGKQEKLREMQFDVKCNEDEHTKLNGNGPSKMNENEFPINNNNEEQHEKINIKTGLVRLNNLLVFNASIWGYSVIQVVINWYLYFMKLKYNSNYWISSFQLTVCGISGVLGILIMIIIATKYKKFLTNVIDSGYHHAVHIIFPLIFSIIVYFITSIDDGNVLIFWFISIGTGLLFGSFYQFNHMIYWKQMKTDTTIYYFIQFVSNIFAAISNLIIGKLLNYESFWFWTSISICFLIQMSIAIMVLTISFIAKKRLTMNGDKDQDSQLTSEFFSLFSPRNPGNDEWKDDDVVGDLKISKMMKNYRQLSTAISKSDLGISDADFMPVFERQPSDHALSLDV